ncbi:MAG TPA: ABC transporter permease [Anaerolineales bacterium]
MIYWRRFFARWLNLLGLTMALAFAVVAVSAPLISPVDPKNPGPFKVVGRFTDQTPRPPGSAKGAAVLGTLPGGLDVFHTLVWGTREAMTFGLLVALGAFLVGVLFGAVAGYAGGRVGTLMMRVADAFLTFPPLAGAAFLQQLAATSVVALGGQYYFNVQLGSNMGNVIFFNGPLPFAAVLIQHVDPLLISLILFSWMPYARVVNTLVLTLKRTEFVLASQAIGAKPFWVIRKHLLPNAVSPAIVLAARDVGGAVILQATMVIIGLGGNSPWGSLLSFAGNWVVGGLLSFWWVYAPVTIAMILFGVTWNIIGDGLSDALSPHS